MQPLSYPPRRFVKRWVWRSCKPDSTRNWAMTDPPPNPQPVEGTADPAIDEREALLIRLLDEFAAQSRASKTPNFEAVRKNHPELFDELRQLWATAMVAEDLAPLSAVFDVPAEKVDVPARVEPPAAGHRRVGD